MKAFTAALTAVFIILLSVFSVRADDNILGYDTSPMFDNLPDNAQGSLDSFGITTPDLSELNDLSFESIFGDILKSAAQSAKTPLTVLAALAAILLLCSLFNSFRDYTRSQTMRTVLSVCASLCVTLTVCVPLLSLIENCAEIIRSASAFMLAYVPVIAFILSASGRVVSASSYYGLVLFSGEFVSAAASSVIAPMLKLLLALSVTSSISAGVNLSGVVKLISKFLKWALGIMTALFSSFLSLKQVIGASLDSASARAVKLGLSSAVPIVGGALSEAYKTVRGSVDMLKSGVGIVALIAIAATFLPSVISCIFWLIALSAGRTLGELLCLSEPVPLLESIGSAVSAALAVLLSVMTVFIISTAVVFTIGGAV